MSKQVESQSVAKAENPKTTGVLQRVKSGEEGEDFQEAASPFYESRFQANLATIPVRAVRPAMIQAKLTVGPANDIYEQEADRVAAQVVQRIHAPVSNSSTQGESVQRKDDDEELQLKPIAPIQRKEMSAGGEVSTDLESEINRARGGGQPLAPDLQAKMGEAMGTDFSGVRVHTDGRADALNQSVGARAFTTGQDLFFKRGEYQPGSRGGQELIAHELTHVLQQKEEKSESIRRTGGGSKFARSGAAPVIYSFLDAIDLAKIAPVSKEQHKEAQEALKNKAVQVKEKILPIEQRIRDRITIENSSGLHWINLLFTDLLPELIEAFNPLWQGYSAPDRGVNTINATIKKIKEFVYMGFDDCMDEKEAEESEKDIDGLLVFIKISLPINFN